MEAKFIIGWAMSQHLPYDETNYDEIVKLEVFLNNPYDSDNDCIIGRDSKILIKKMKQ